MLNPPTWLARSPQGIYGCFSKGHGYIVLHVEVHRARIEHLSNQNMGTADAADNPRCVDLPYVPAPSNESRVLRAGQSHCLFGGQSAFQRLGSICGLDWRKFSNWVLCCETCFLATWKSARCCPQIPSTIAYSLDNDGYLSMRPVRDAELHQQIRWNHRLMAMVSSLLVKCHSFMLGVNLPQLSQILSHAGYKTRSTCLKKMQISKAMPWGIYLRMAYPRKARVGSREDIDDIDWSKSCPQDLPRVSLATVSHINFGNVPFCICMLYTDASFKHIYNIVCMQNCSLFVPSAMFVLSYLDIYDDILMKLPMSQCLCSFWSSWCLMFRSWRMETWSPKTSTDPP